MDAGTPLDAVGCSVSIGNPEKHLPGRHGWLVTGWLGKIQRNCERFFVKMEVSNPQLSTGSGGRLCTRFLGSQVHADGSRPGSQVHADGSGQGRKGNGLVCTRGQGPYLYTRPRASSVHAEWFCCMYTFVLTAVYFVCSMCAGCQVQVFSSLTAVYIVCSMCAGCQVPNNVLWTCVKYVPKQSIP